MQIPGNNAEAWHNSARHPELQVFTHITYSKMTVYRIHLFIHFYYMTRCPFPLKLPSALLIFSITTAHRSSSLQYWPGSEDTHRHPSPTSDTSEEWEGQLKTIKYKRVCIFPRQCLASTACTASGGSQTMSPKKLLTSRGGSRPLLQRGMTRTSTGLKTGHIFFFFFHY